MVLEVDVQYLGSGVKDEELGRPRHPQLCMMCDSSSGMMLAADLTEAGEDPISSISQDDLTMLMTLLNQPESL